MEKQHSSISSFKAVFKQIGLLVLIFWVTAFVFSLLFDRLIIFSSEATGASKIHRILYERHANEIPILGSSRAEGSYVPSILHENCFNYGIPGTQSKVWLFFLEEELKKNKQSPIIINFDALGFTAGIGAVHNYIPDYPTTKPLLRDEQQFYYRIPFVKYFGYYDHYFSSYLNEKSELTRHIEKGGSFRSLPLAPNKFEALVKKRKQTSARFQKDNSLHRKFDKLVSSTNRCIYLVVAPYHASYFEKFKNWDEASGFLSEMNQRPNIVVLDHSHDSLPDSLFTNTTHLNYAGAKRFSKQLKADLQSHKCN